MATKRNLSPTRCPMPVLDPAERGKCFSEVALGYTEEMAISEAARCLNCTDPACVKGCPVGVHIPSFIQKITVGEYESAYRIITESSSLPAVCGRVCPQESQCEAQCVRGIKGEPVAIGRLERFVADRHNATAAEEVEKPTPNGHRVAIVGSGPAGLACAGDLAKLGYAVTVFEALHVAGGVLMYGIPEFRLPKTVVQTEIRTLKSLGVDFQTNVVIGKTVTVDELFEDGFEAVFIGSGAGLPRFMGIPGESLCGVYSANEFLTRSNLMGAFREGAATPILHPRRVAVVGGGNVAMDAARTALRLGAEEVSIVYRRSLDELPARREEVEHAMEEGIQFRLLTNPTAIHGYRNESDPRDPKNGFVTGMACVRMELGEPDERGRRSPVEIPDSAFELEVDCVIMAIGTSPNPLIRSTTDGLAVNSRGGFVVTEEGATTREGVFAGGDAVTGAATVILAMGAGKTAAQGIHKHLQQGRHEAADGQL